MRDYVDDSMLRELSHDIPTLIHKVHAGLQFAKQLIRHAGLKDNEAEEHIFTPNKKVSDAFKLAYPDMADKVVNTAKDLGVCQRRHNRANPVISQRTRDRKAYTARVRTLRDLTQAQRSAVLEMGHNSSVFYGAEVDPPTEKQLSTSRAAICNAIFPQARHRSHSLLWPSR